MQQTIGSPQDQVEDTPTGPNVRVWAPEPALAKEEAENAWTKFLILIGVGCLIGFLAGGFEVFMPADDFVGPLSAWCRPSYLTTDDTQIRLTTGNRSRTVRWADISRIHRGSSYRTMFLYAPRRIELNLSGYKHWRRKELCALIVSQSGLEADPDDPLVFTRGQDRVAGHA